MNCYARVVSTAICLIALQTVSSAQAPAAKTKKAVEKKVAAEADPLAETRRTMAGSLLRPLADGARSFRDLACVRLCRLAQPMPCGTPTLMMRVEFKGGGAMTNNFNVDSFDLTGLFTTLAEEDFNRAADLARAPAL